MAFPLAKNNHSGVIVIDDLGEILRGASGINPAIRSKAIRHSKPMSLVALYQPKCVLKKQHGRHPCNADHRESGNDGGNHPCS